MRGTVVIPDEVQLEEPPEEEELVEVLVEEVVVEVDSTVGVGVSVGVGVGVGVSVGVGVGVGAQSCLAMVELFRVTAPFLASKRPSMVDPPSSVIEVKAITVPIR